MLKTDNSLITHILFLNSVVVIKTDGYLKVKSAFCKKSKCLQITLKPSYNVSFSQLELSQ